MGRAGQGGRTVGTLADPSGAGATVGSCGGRLGGVAAISPARVAQGGPGHTPPQERSRGATGVEKKLPETLAATLNRIDLGGRSVRLMFQDEARFGRMARPRRCWAPLPWRPVMLNGYERQFVYVYGAVSPLQGDLDWMLCREMNAVRMGEFLGQVSRAHPDEFIVMVLDGASSHKAKDLGVPENIRLVPLPAYAPELNPQEHVWDELREKEFPNRVFNHLDAVIAQLRIGLPRLAEDHDRVRSLTAWPWIVSLNLTACCLNVHGNSQGRGIHDSGPESNQPVRRVPDAPQCYFSLRIDSRLFEEAPGQKRFTRGKRSDPQDFSFHFFDRTNLGP